MAAFNRLGRERREYYTRVWPFQRYKDKKFVARYRITKEIAQGLIDDYSETNFATCGRLNGGGLTHENHFCLGLRYLACGSMYGVIGDTQGVHKSTVSRAVRDVMDYLCSIANQHIKFPEPHQYADASYDFSKYGFPGVIGCIDGTHVAIEGPSEDEVAFVNRMKYHSLNVLACCDADMCFTYINPTFPGSQHDSYIMKGERKRFGSHFLLGDSGFALKPFLMRPLLRAVTRGEKKYNKAHKTTRNLVELMFGNWKRRFRCVDSSGGFIQGKPERAARIILATAVLHNICRRNRIPIRRDNDEDANRRPRRRRARVPPRVHAPSRRGLQMQDPTGNEVSQRLIQCRFNPH